MKTPLRFLKKTALAAVFAASAATVCAATSLTQPRLAWFSQAAITATYTGDAPIVETDFVEIDGDTVFTPSPASGTNATIQLTVSFSTLPAELPSTDMTGAQAAITAAAPNDTAAYYVYGKATANGDAGWIAVTVQGLTPVAEQSVDVTIDIDYETGKATYIIGSTIAASVFLANVPATTSVGSLKFAGNGTISGTIVGTKGTATHTLGNANYGSYADALAAAIQNGGSIESWSGDAANGWTSAATAGTGVGSGTSLAPYEIRSVDDLLTLAALVQTTNCAGVVFQQVANIDFTGAAAFAGIGTYNATPTSGKPFSGTYDGGNFKISNVTMTARNYGGVFNQVNGGTIKNLTVENVSVPAAATGEYGYAIVGNAGNGATLQNLVSSGSFGSADKPGTHNMAGIVIRASAGGSGTLVASCTNNAAIYGSYTKLAGICAITQVKVAGNAVSFENCANNGALTMPSGSTAGRDGLAGIVGYVADNTVLTGCSNTGTMTSSLTTARIGELVGYGYDHTLTDNGGNVAFSSGKMVASRSPSSFLDSENKTHTFVETGFQYATVDNGVATTLASPYTLAKDTTYLLEGDAAPSFALSAGDSITFDTALGYTLTETGITAATGAKLAEPVVNGTAKTFSAIARKYPAVFLRTLTQVGD